MVFGIWKNVQHKRPLLYILANCKNNILQYGKSLDFSTGVNFFDNMNLHSLNWYPAALLISPFFTGITVSLMKINSGFVTNHIINVVDKHFYHHRVTAKKNLQLKQRSFKCLSYLHMFHNYPVLLSSSEQKDLFEENSSDKNNVTNNGWNDLPDEERMNDMMHYFQEQAPKLFTSEGWSYIRCSYKVTFENRLIGTKTETLNSYIFQVNLMKKITNFLLYKPKLNIIRMTKNTLDGSIQVRWQVTGIPRYIKPLAKIGLVTESESTRHLDGISIFYMKKDGLYYRHVLMKMTPMKSEDFRPVFSQIVSNFIYKPSFQPSLETNVSNKIK